MREKNPLVGGALDPHPWYLRGVRGVARGTRGGFTEGWVGREGGAAAVDHANKRGNR